MNRGTIWLDVDGVLLDYTTAFLKFTGLDKQGYKYENIFDYDLTKLFYGGADECHKAMLDFTRSADFKSLPCLALQMDLELLFNMGFKLKVITMLPTDAQYKVNRVKALTAHFGPVFSGMIFTDRKDCKLDYIVNSPDFLKEKNILVEDNPNLLRKVDAYIRNDIKQRGRTNLLCYAISHPYNEKDLIPLDTLVVCKDFHCTTNMIAMEALGG